MSQGAVPVKFTASGASPVAAYAPGPANPDAGVQPIVKVLGFTAKNTGATAATIEIRDGSATGPLITSATLAIGNTTPTYADTPIPAARRANNGLWAVITGGTVEAYVWVE